MAFDGTCVRCGSVLRHLCTDGSDINGVVYNHYRCVNDGCKADGGSVVLCDGTVTRAVGSAVSLESAIPRDTYQEVHLG